MPNTKLVFLLFGSIVFCGLLATDKLQSHRAYA